MNGEKLPYGTAFAYLFKFNWAVGERILRALLLNRRAPEVGAIERDLPYVEEGSRLQKLDVFIPPSEPPYPVLVYVHGGGNHVGDKRTYDRICRVFASSGYLVFNANYRMAPRFGYREQLQDTAAAVNWAYAHAQDYGGDPGRVFLAGDSAGAYHAAMYAAEALHPDLRRALSIPTCIPASCIRGLLLFYGVYDLVTVGDTGFPFGRMLITGFLGRDPGLFREGAELASPVRYVTPQFPPCYLATSEIDQLHSQTLDFVRALAENGVEHELLNLTRREHPLTYHGFLNFWYTRGAALAMDGALRFLESHG
ncbi:MAG: alpha/beta hydrolase fold domain-containing protein [Actinobacteria bacterium]|nr:alpha/beta hydrolase fold domain-containing protein [Actinomycetota bacterium]